LAKTDKIALKAETKMLFNCGKKNFQHEWAATTARYFPKISR